MDAWENGTYLVTIFHHRAGANEREVLRYHSAEEVLKYGVENLETGTIETERIIDA